MFRRRRADDDFGHEVQAHLELETDRLVAEGLPPAEARIAARRKFGSLALVKEQCFESTRWMSLEHALQDVRYAPIARTFSAPWSPPAPSCASSWPSPRGWPASAQPSAWPPRWCP
jgi:hypothetical protein